MKVTVYKPVELEIHTVRIEVELHDDVSENLPKHLFNDDGELDLLIEVDTGKVVSWQGNEPVLYMTTSEIMGFIPCLINAVVR